MHRNRPAIINRWSRSRRSNDYRLRAKDSFGFTLIELMVAVTLFSVVMTISVSTLLSLVDANRKAQGLESVMNNLNFALENMSRNIRVGSTYHCSTSATPPVNLDTPNDCASGGVLIAVEPSGGDPNDDTDQIVYRWTGDQLERSTNGGAQFVGITASEVNITDFSFYVVGSASTDSQQPRVVMTIQGEAGVTEELTTEFNLQATVSQRAIDF